MANLLLIESPGKVRKLSQILGPGWMVKASVGHVRELANDGEDSLGFDLGNGNVDCRYVPRSPKAKKILTDLRKAVKQADSVYIATDPDREGETIGWHLQQALRLKQPHRVVYSEITPAAVRAAIAKPRRLDPALVAAGRARDCLDKLVGYKGSRHVVWPLRNGAKSMGRVQSATLHLICEREREIRAFKPEDYWSVWVQYHEGFKAFYRQSPQAKTGRQAKPQQKQNASKSDPADTPESDRIRSQAAADSLVELARTSPHQVVSVEGTTKKQSPPPPFITSTLQQAAGSKLRLSPERTMKLAQSLYEAGHITYMRTDSVALAEPFKAAVKQYLQQHDPDNVPQRQTRHRVSKSAQAAHEAVRPTKVEQTPSRLGSQLDSDAGKLYELIWNRAIASQCSPARLRKTRIVTHCQREGGEYNAKSKGDDTTSDPRNWAEAYWEARGQVVEFAGYTRYWNNLSADSQLPAVKPGQPLKLAQAQADQKQTQPPPRYTEPKLIQLMERKGIGRPSTYAPTLKTLRDRTYAELKKGKLVPTLLGLSLDEALGKLLPDLIQPAFTAAMEAKLDEIATSTTADQAWQSYLVGWHREYFAPAIAQAQQKMGEVLSMQASTSQTVPSQTVTSQKATPQTFTPPSEQSYAKQPKPSRRTSAQSSKPSQCPCPKCGERLQKVPSKSKKMKANHYLRCETTGCNTVMFWSPRKKAYELPHSQRSLEPANFTDYPCPVCGALLEKHAYEKEGKAKVMLRCSVFERRKDKCKSVAYFQGKYGFWSPKFGNLKRL